MTYQEVITKELGELAKNNRVRFVGYNTRFGHRMYGTLSPVHAAKCIETPVAENLMTGLAMGISLVGKDIPILCFERMDFMLPAMDALINQMDKLPLLSGEFNFPVIIRAIVGTNEPLDPGPQHTGDYTLMFAERCKNIQVYKYEPGIYHRLVLDMVFHKQPRLVVEYKKDYAREV